MIIVDPKTVTCFSTSYLGSPESPKFSVTIHRHECVSFDLEVTEDQFNRLSRGETVHIPETRGEKLAERLFTSDVANILNVNRPGCTIFLHLQHPAEYSLLLARQAVAAEVDAEIKKSVDDARREIIPQKLARVITEMLLGEQ